MKLGLQLGYWGAQPPPSAGELVVAAEQAGFDAVFTAEAWGSDAYTPLAWWGASTQRLRLGTSVVQLSARTPTACAMAALTLDHLSGGRHILGLGVSGPQVVEGWYGQRFPKPLARTREYIDILRQVWARRQPVTSAGPHYPLPLAGVGTTGLGKALKPIVHPLRADIPVMLGAEGPKNVALAAEICDGWLPIFYTPRLAGMYGMARRGLRATGCPAQPGGLRDLRKRPGGHHRRPCRGVRRHQTVPGAVHGWDGRRRHQLPRRRLPPDGLLGGRRRRHPAVPLWPQGRSGRDHPRRARRRRRRRRRHRLRAQADRRLGSRRGDDDGDHRG